MRRDKWLSGAKPKLNKWLFSLFAEGSLHNKAPRGDVCSIWGLDTIWIILLILVISFQNTPNLYLYTLGLCSWMETVHLCVWWLSSFSDKREDDVRHCRSTRPSRLPCWQFCRTAQQQRGGNMLTCRCFVAVTFTMFTISIWLVSMLMSALYTKYNKPSNVKFIKTSQQFIKQLMRYFNRLFQRLIWSKTVTLLSSK